MPKVLQDARERAQFFHRGDSGGADALWQRKWSVFRIEAVQETLPYTADPVVGMLLNLVAVTESFRLRYS